MSVMETVKSLFWPNPTAGYPRKAMLPSTEYFGPAGQRAADWSVVGTSAKVRDAWMKCSTAFACITLLADAVAESPLRAYRPNPAGDLEEVPNHRAAYLLEEPNPWMSGAEFRSLLVMTMGLHGYGIVEKVRSGARLPVQLWPLRPDWLKREYTGVSTNATRWVYRVPTRDPRPIADEDILIIPYYHDPAQINLGISPLHIIAREVGIDVALTDLLKVFIDNGGIPPWVVKLSDDVSFNQEEADAFRIKWAQYYAGSRAYGTIGILNPGMDLVKVGDSIGDMAWPDLRALTEMKIAQAFRVPADLIQARDSMSSGSLTTTEMDGAMSFLQNHGAQPLRTRIDGAFSRGLLPDFGSESGVVLEFDTSMILALQEDEDARHARVRADWQAGLITLNEARRETDRPDLGTGGEVFLQGFTSSYVSIGDLTGGNGTEHAARGTTIAPKAMPGEDTSLLALPGRAKNVTGTSNMRITLQGSRTYRDLKALSPGELEVRASGLRSIQRDKQRLEEIGTRQLRKFFREQGRRVVAAMPKSGPVANVKADRLDWQDEEDALRELLMRFYGASGERAYANVAATVGVEIAWDLANPHIREILNDLGHRIVGISDTTRQDVVRVITDGQAEGLTLQQISDNLTGMFEETYKGRAMTISRTETMASYGKASILGYQESGVVDQAELVDNPDHTEPYEGADDGLTCAERHGLVVPLEQAEFHLMSDHPNGSATVIPILSTPLGET